MISTFHYKQELKASEFGTLLKDLLPAGIYKLPSSIVIEGSTVTLRGGTYLFYNYDKENNKDFAICVKLEDSEGDQITTTGVAVGATVYLTYSFQEGSTNTRPLLRVGTPDSSANRDSYIILGRIDSQSRLVTSFQDVRGQGFSYPTLEITSLTFDHPVGDSTGTLKVEVNGYYMTGYGVKSVAPLSTSVTFENGNYVYVDPKGVLKVGEFKSNSTFANTSVELLTRHVLAYRDPGSEEFVILRQSRPAEITAASISISSDGAPSTQSTSALNDIYNQSKNTSNTGAKVPILEKVIQRLVKEVQELRKELGSKGDSSSADTVYGRIKKEEEATTAAKTSITTGTLNVTTKLNVNAPAAFTKGSVDFSNVNLTFKNTNFGTKSNPISSLYVSNVLYAENAEFLLN